ncbi:MAG TPA: hypothetical protein VGG39_15840 [Polyangiaceae bacterium]|jgi:hypothetical protein
MPGDRNAAVRVFFAALLTACAAPSGQPGAPAEEASTPQTQAPSSPPAPPAPPYDLATDLASRVADARFPAVLGPGAVSAVVSSSFLLVAAHKGWPFDAEVALAQRSLPAMFHDRFFGPPDRAITVFLFPSDDPYVEFCVRRYGAACTSDYGQYDTVRREIVVNAGPGGPTTLLHELVHAIGTEFPTMPDWFEEGLATAFEIPVQSGPYEIHSGPNKRHQMLLGEIRNPTSELTVSLDQLFAVTRAEVRGATEWLVYAMSNDFCAWLDSQHKLWPFYRFWRDHADRDRTGRWSFEKVMGQRPEAMTDAWLTWVQRGR